MVLYDVTKPSTFASVKKWVEELREHASPHIVTMLVGNKTDLESLRSVTVEEAATFAGAPLETHLKRFKLANTICTAENGMEFIETSALDSSNVEFAFRTVLTNIYHIQLCKHVDPGSNLSKKPLRMIERRMFDI